MDNILQKIPPQANDVEEAVLGAIMIEPGADIPALETLKSESFYSEKHQKIFKAIYELSTLHIPIDQISVAEQLRKNSDLEFVGGAYYINYLASNVGTSAHLEYHTKIIAEKYIKRELINIANQIQKKSYEASSDIEELLNFSEKQIFDLAFENISKATKPLNIIIKETKDHIEELSKREHSFSGVPSGFTSLDRITSGWQPSDLVIVAARPSMGKTAFVLSMARNMSVEHDVPVAFFSLEMSSHQLATRLIVSETGIGSEKLRTGKLSAEEWQILEEKSKNLSEAKIYIDDTEAISLTELRAKCRNLKIQYDIQLVIIDYLQLMSGNSSSNTNREQEVSQISRGLKAIAKELNVPVIALSQLNRSVENRTGKRPQLSDLRESGAIEQDADIVIFIHRPEKYGDLKDEEGNSLEGVAEIIISKHRNGAITDVQLEFIDYLAKFQEPENIIDFNQDSTGNEVILNSKMNQDDGLYSDDIPNDTPF
ncbi:MAG: replicative DNA helicase [Bacteroidota bacterium]|nr:replicative DNA helicase [Bacteroidota bacterium]